MAHSAGVFRPMFPVSMLTMTTTPSELGAYADRATQVANALSEGSLFVAAIAIVGGLILWLSGGRLMRAATVVGAAACLGAAAFQFAQAFFAPGWAPIAAMAVGVAVGIALGLFLFRIAMAVTLAGVLGLAAPLIAVAALNIRPAPPPEGSEPLSIEQLLLPGVPVEDERQGDAASSDTGASQDEAAADLRRRAEAFADAAADEARVYWDRVPARDRTIIVGAALTAAALGLALGLIAPALAGAASTSAAGSAMWLSGLGYVLTTQAGKTVADSVPDRPAHWAIIWIATTAAGVLIQWAFVRKRPAKPRSIRESPQND